jgi:1-acyl-sn-glycerol-3-phosphate acyltransferase
MIRSILFDILSAIWTIFCAIFFAPMGISKRLSKKLSKLWAHGVLFILRVTCNIKYEIENLDKIPSGGSILLGKHQSMWETVVLLTLIPNVSYVIKKELLSIPFYGWYLKNMGMIPVDRKGGIKSARKMLSDIEEALGEGSNVVIFPQGTRTPQNATLDIYPYRLSVSKLLPKNGFIPFALNSGLFWSKGIFSKKKPGIIKMRFLDVMTSIESDNDKNTLIEAIEKSSMELSQKAKL